MSDDSDDSIWIKTVPNALGAGYTVSIEAGSDLAATLTPERALRYAHGILSAVQYAEYDAAIARQLNSVLKQPNSTELIGQVLVDVRNERPPLDDADTYPIFLVPGVNAKCEPFLHLYLASLPDEPQGQWTLADAREHARVAIEAVIAADLDATYQRVLTSLVGVPPGTARNMIDDLGKWRDQ